MMDEKGWSTDEQTSKKKWMERKKGQTLEQRTHQQRNARLKKANQLHKEKRKHTVQGHEEIGGRLLGKE